MTVPLCLPLWAVHVSDGVLAEGWLAAGWVIAGLLALLGGWRCRDEEIPRVALLTAAFFVASSLRVPLPGSNAHLLLTGLLGVVLGRRAALAVPVGLFLQAVLFGHGGYTSLGVNSVVMTLPALGCWLLFSHIRSMDLLRLPWLRALLVAVSVALWVLCLSYGLVLLAADAGPLTPIGHGVIVTITFVLAAVAAWAERRLENAPEFPLGLLIGELGVLGTCLLHSVVLYWGRTVLPDDTSRQAWYTLAVLIFLAHLPIAAVEGIVLGFTVGFLARVKPDLLTGRVSDNKSVDHAAPRPAHVPFLTAFACLFLLPLAEAKAHRLEAEYHLLPGNRVQIESWFDLNGATPKDAVVHVYRPDGSLFVDGRLDDRGVFVFSSERDEPLRVVVSASDGHRAEVVIPGGAHSAALTVPLSDHASRTSLKDVVIGVGFVLAVAAFVLSLRNARALRALRAREVGHESSEPEA